MSDEKKYNDRLSDRLNDLKIIVDVSEKVLSVYKQQLHLIHESVITNQKEVIKHYKDLLRAKEKELSYNKDEPSASEK